MRSRFAWVLVALMWSLAIYVGFRITVDDRLFLPGSVFGVALEVRKRVPIEVTELMAFSSEGRDWIEIHNRDSASVDLDDYWLSNEAQNTRKWWLPSVDLKPDQYFVFHVPEPLESAGGYLQLADDEEIVWSFSPRYPEQRVDVSYGLRESAWLYFEEPTPGAANSAEKAWPRLLDIPSFSAKRGPRRMPFELRIHAQPSAKILFSTDGSEPTEESGRLYEKPIRISDAAIVRAKAMKEHALSSRVQTHTFLKPEASTLPVVSLAFASASGSASGEDVEKEASFEWIDHERVKPSFQIDGGGRVRGGSEDRPDFELFFRRKYGRAKLCADVFLERTDARCFDALELEAQDLYLRKTFVRKSLEAMGERVPRGRFVRVLWNGKDLGVYELLEKLASSPEPDTLDARIDREILRYYMDEKVVVDRAHAKRFQERALKHLSEGGALSDDAAVKRFVSIARPVYGVMPAEAKKWSSEYFSKRSAIVLEKIKADLFQ